MHKSFLIILITTTLFNLTISAQSYNKYMQQGKDFYDKNEYIIALEHFNLAYEFARTKTQEKDVQNWKNKSLEKIKEQQFDLRKALANVKAEAENALKKAEQLQLKVETAMFDKAVKERNIDWKGYANYQSWETSEKNKILVKIDTLNLSANALLSLPKEITKCKNLKSLNLLKNENIDWDDCFKKLASCPQLTELKVSVKDLHQIDSVYWKRITGLEITAKNLTGIPQNILNQKQLTYLDVSGEYFNKNTIKSLPLALFELKDLKYLNLSYCEIIELPPKIGKLTNLTSLNLRNNKLTALSPEITKLIGLTYLDLGENLLSKIPPEIGKLTNLKYLNFGSNSWSHDKNQLSSLPLEISKLTNLTELNLYGNDSLDFKSVCNAFEDYPRKLIIRSDKLAEQNDTEILLIKIPEQSSLPPEIGKLTNLIELWLGNKLTKLPPEIGNLKNLTILHLNNNGLTSLPSEIGNVAKL